MRRIYQIGIIFFDLTLKLHYKASIGKGTISVSEQLRLVHILNYHAVSNVYGLLLNQCFTSLFGTNLLLSDIVIR